MMVLAAMVLLPFSAPPAAPYAAARRLMVERHLKGRDITDAAVLGAMKRVDRHAFVPAEMRGKAYADRPLPIGHSQTISQPYIVALMTQLAGARPGAKVLDVGTGSGYQAAVLAEIVGHVYSIEIVCPLADPARTRLKALGYTNITVRCGDGYAGWKEHAPFDLIVLAAAPDHVPPALKAQLAIGGRLVLPVGDQTQRLKLIERKADGSYHSSDHGGVMFVPMTGEARDPQ